MLQDIENTEDQYLSFQKKFLAENEFYTLLFTIHTDDYFFMCLVINEKIELYNSEFYQKEGFIEVLSVRKFIKNPFSWYALVNQARALIDYSYFVRSLTFEQLEIYKSGKLLIDFTTEK